MVAAFSYVDCSTQANQSEIDVFAKLWLDDRFLMIFPLVVHLNYFSSTVLYIRIIVLQLLFVTVIDFIHTVFTTVTAILKILNMYCVINQL